MKTRRRKRTTKENQHAMDKMEKAAVHQHNNSGTKSNVMSESPRTREEGGGGAGRSRDSILMAAAGKQRG